MEMDSSRRPFDRSREQGIKKPRLTDELERGSNSSVRSLPQRQVASGVNSLAPARFRTNDRDSESIDSGRGGYQPQPLHHELVNQYKTALAELTFNSKPIITNLTIIAGENLYAAKAIAATVCANILEVPTEQKLPSLYLLDSIVKNIGRDYIKYFAARLPEVFCKAYKQVDSTIHSSMRHLFGTWKGVFPPQTLQIIEKELGFTPAVNGSSTASTLRSDSQSQRPQHSIHVNPKYLERQRLQQSGRIKGTANDIAGTITSSSDGAERPDRALGAARPWVDSSADMHGIGTSYGGNEYGSDLSRNSGLGIGRAGGRTSELARDKAWYKAGSNAADMMSAQRNGFSLKRSLSNHEAPKSINLDEHNQPTQTMTGIKSSVLSSSWKNSEEEEYMWDEVNAGLSEHGASNASNNLSKECWTADEDNLAVGGHLQRTLHEDRDVSTEMKRTFGHPWKSQQQQSFDELNRRPCPSEGIGSALGRLPNIVNSSNVKMGNRPFLSNATLGSVGTVRQQQSHSVGAESPWESPLRQQSPSPSVNVPHPHEMQILAEQDHPQTLKTSQFSGRLRSQDIRDSSSVLPRNVQAGNSQRSHQKDLQGPLSSVSTFQPRHHSAASQPQDLGSNSEVPEMKGKMTHSKETSEQSTTSSMLAAVMKSGIFTSGQHGISFLDRRNLPSKSGVQPARPSGSSPTTSVSSGPGVASPSRLGPSNDGLSTLSKESQGKVGAPSRLPALPPASSTVSSASAKTSSATNNKSDPVSNLLNSLVAKGLISAKTDSSTEVPAEVLIRLEDQSQSITTSGTLPAVSVTGSETVPVISTGDDQPAKGSSSQSTPTEIKNLIGFEFKPSVIRELHLPVIRELLDDFPHHCSICGLRLKHQEQFNRHLEWHAMREREQNDILKASRRWYLRSSDWVDGKDEVSSEYEGIDSIDLHGNKSNRSEEDAMAPSDEDQCLCMLCGELFEDVYCQERDEWMFKGAVYLPVSSSDSETDTNVSSERGPIVHTWCLSESSISNVLAKEQD
ncbi:polyadenylation and cleavage factor homolog 4 isoform X2 [Neltuma alba]|uniref:polyadenylation and cleavage factor homolog 4 isoform X2 n=1 Tax=Neltuma alba TaxID=207710 RepID=UPI0010A54BC6|nr:polyadenylation and cleavage factor homolog 4 isoform X2 [Prosopis alba]